MTTVTIRKSDGSEAGSVELKDSVFAVEPNLQCVRTALSQYMANQRAGTHSTKMRGDVRGGGRKPWRQKGTGRARQGSTRAPQWRGGAIVFGPQPRDYAFRVNKKVRRQAYRSIWSNLVQEGRLIVIDDFAIDRPKTHRFQEIMDALGVDGTALVITARTDETLFMSCRNLPWVTMINADNLNVYDLLNHDWVVLTSEAIKLVEEANA